MQSKLIAILILSLGSLSVANATVTSSSSCGFIAELLGWCKPGHKGPPAQTPEIDPAGAASALTLLAGGLAVLRGRHLKKK